MVQIPSSAGNDQVKHIPEKFLSGTVMYGTEERGMVLILPGEDLPPARFGDNPGKHHLCVLDMEKERNGIPPEIQRRMAMAVEKTKPFILGRVFYVKSKEELEAEEKKKEQAKFLKELKESLAGGVVMIDLDKSVADLCEVADKIGAVYLDKNGKPSMKHVIQKNIKELLGLTETAPAPELPEEKPEVKTQPKRTVKKKGSK
jgi:hypothetical protein